MWALFKTIVWRDLTIAARRGGEVLLPLVFFIIVVSLFPIALGARPGVGPAAEEILTAIAPGVVWVAALLSALLALERLFAADYQDSTLEQMLLAPQPLTIVVLAKVFAHWLLTGLPLVLASPVVALLYQLPVAQWAAMMWSLLLGTPALSLIGALGAALTLGARGGGVLLSLLLLPLYVPVLIYGAGAITAAIAAAGGANPTTAAYYMLLGAITCLAAALSPWATAVALRISMQ